ncbi:MAG: UDP-glucose 4-epimerase GalE [Campylobacter sp.]|nr:UDP-glucose 4-epimerase GalE [Campylobacter sp.]
MRILLTGAAGYIGSHTLKALLEESGHEIVAIDNFYSGDKKTIEILRDIAGFTFIECDTADTKELDEIFSEYKFEAIMHFAAYIEVFESTQKPLKYYENNVVNAINLINLAVKYGVKNFIFSSTAATYGEPESGVVDENSSQNPINPYGRSKLMVEWILKDTAAANAGFNYGILRYFNVAGADGLIGQNYPNATHLIKVATQTITGQRKSMSIFGDDYDTKDGTCIRDYIHVNDLASAHLSVLKYINNHGSEIFNVGYGKGYSVKEVIEVAKEVSGVDFTANLAPRRAGDPAVLISNVDKIKNLTDWKPKFDDLKLIIDSALKWEEKLIK